MTKTWHMLALGLVLLGCGDDDASESLDACATCMMPDAMPDAPEPWGCCPHDFEVTSEGCARFGGLRENYGCNWSCVPCATNLRVEIDSYGCEVLAYDEPDIGEDAATCF